MLNYAFIDGQNLHLGTTRSITPWEIDLARFRVYLGRKYRVGKAFYFLGYYDPTHYNLYNTIQAAGFILSFREHSPGMTSPKKGNVDTDVVFEIMKSIIKDTELDKVVLVSGDGDYWKTVDFLIAENRFEKLLVPNRKSLSSMYKRFPDTFRNLLDEPGVQKKIKKQ